MEKTNPVRRLIKAIRNSRSGERQGDKTAKTISVPQLIRAIRKLPSDESINDSRVWYTTQKQHWLGWLREYNGPGGYGRIPGQNRDARYAYNHIVNPQMLAYLNHASGASPEVEQEIEEILKRDCTLQAMSAAIRRLVPWEVVAEKLFGPGAK